MNSLSPKKRFFRCLSIAAIWVLLFSLVGCESFARKFTRKHKNEQSVEMVISPEEYKGPNMSREELYRLYFTYWKSWHEELINSLLYKASQKKQIDCAQETAKNLTNMRKLLNEDKQRKLDIYINKINGFKSDIEKDVYGVSASNLVQSVEKTKMNIMRDFSYPKIKNYML